MENSHPAECLKDVLRELLKIEPGRFRKFRHCLNFQGFHVRSPLALQCLLLWKGWTILEQAHLLSRDETSVELGKIQDRLSTSDGREERRLRAEIASQRGSGNAEGIPINEALNMLCVLIIALLDSHPNEVEKYIRVSFKAKEEVGPVLGIPREVVLDELRGLGIEDLIIT